MIHISCIVNGFRGVLEWLANCFLKALGGNPFFLDHLGRSLSKNDLKVVEYNVINMECILRVSEVCWNGSSTAS